MSTTPVNPVVEMLIDGAWVDITADCRQASADSGGGFEISRGVPNEGNFAEPTQFNFTLNNGVSKAPSTEGQVAVYSPTNLQGPYFGQLGRNQRVRVGLDRRRDDFSHNETDSWGYLPDHAHADGTTILPGEKWSIYGEDTVFNVSGGLGTIDSTSGLKMALVEKTYRDVDVLARISVSNRTTEYGIILRCSEFVVDPPVGTDLAGATGWGSSQGTVATDSSVFRGENTTSARLTVTGSPATATLANTVGTTTMWNTPNGPNGSYFLRVWLRSSDARNVRCAISWYKEDGSTFISSSTGSDTAVAANTWTMVSLTASPPQDAKYVRVSGVLLGSPPAGTQLWLSDPELHDRQSARYYQASILPGGTDQFRLMKMVDGLAWVTSTNLSSNIVEGTWYWVRAQVTGQRIRMKLWQDGTTEPAAWNARWFDDNIVDAGSVGRTGRVGIMASGGSATVQVGEVQFDQWRAHAEIARLPVRFDLSRFDRWVPIQARGILRRLNQGRKALKSAVSLHLEEYIGDSYGWWPMEEDGGDSAVNNVPGSNPGRITGLEFAEPETTGQAALQGVSGLATLSTDAAIFNGTVLNHTVSNGRQTMLWFMRLPNLPASEVLLATLQSTGTARTWTVSVTSSGALRVIAYDRSGVQLDNQSVSAWNGNPDLPTGCWLATTLYLLQDGANVDWALNHHRPGSDTFWTLTGTFAGTVGTYTGITFRSNSVLTAAGNLQITQVMHYDGDLPFVDYDFRKAAQAYVEEEAAARALRLGANANVPITTTGSSSRSVPMGPQLPSKLVELWEEVGEADGGFLMEERDDFGLTYVTRDSLWNRETFELDIDAGHLTTPLEGDFDDQQVRNDVTISRPGGSGRRVTKVSGPLNINPPEEDPQGVGTYDEQKSVNVATDSLCGSHANYRVSRGTLEDPRYPAFHANLAASAYQADAALAAEAIGVDVGDAVVLVNTEADYAPRRQTVQSYVETVRDLYEYDIVWTAIPDQTRQVGVVNYTTRVGSESMYVAADFDAGTDTQLQVTSDNGQRFVSLEKGDFHFPMDIEAAGVQLRVTMTGVVLNTNPGFESGTTGWVAVGGIANAVDLWDPKEGTYALRTHAAGAGTFGMATASGNGVAVSVGAQYRVSGWVKTEVAATALEIAMDWYNGAAAFLSASVGESLTSTVADQWTFLSGVVTAPASAVTGRIRVSNTFAGATRMWLDSLRITAVSSDAGSTQILTVEQEPVNSNFGASGKTIPAGSTIRIVDAARVGWGESS